MWKSFWSYQFTSLTGLLVWSLKMPLKLPSSSQGNKVFKWQGWHPDIPLLVFYLLSHCKSSLMPFRQKTFLNILWLFTYLPLKCVATTGCSINIVSFPKILKYSGLWPFSVFPRHIRQVEHQCCSRTGRIQKNHNILKKKNTIFNEHPVVKK